MITTQLNSVQGLGEIDDVIHICFPISVAMGVRTQSYDDTSLILFAPLDRNINHKSSAFGGSISALAILSGWTFLFLKLNELDIRSQLVIQKSEFNFIRPIDSDFMADTSMPSRSSWQKFLKTLDKHGRARISIRSVVGCKSCVGGIHDGVYVAEVQD
ncbi:thioesterase domain-containing protein, putative [Trichlorobacter thiogenes]|uniref:Thioesterase domain-containing protein, putative n=1 Tax=Trichlorobacter thiogenes TaxID=115783 RepID=A0A1T4S538_9BACT|nr:YiiD C-terminal domain-containing protein [Trichlorobacter thiogenes]SKA23399.1 thioesterase domain-containing protein, putative [Trichlorobacter thiogenes]